MVSAARSVSPAAAELVPPSNGNYHHRRSYEPEDDDDADSYNAVDRSSHSPSTASVELVARGRSSRSLSTSTTASKGSFRSKMPSWVTNMGRRTLGIVLLLVVVFLWTVSNFLASVMFADGSYNKPFFLLYVNISMFALALIPMGIRHVMQYGWPASKRQLVEAWYEIRQGRSYQKVAMVDDEDARAGESLLIDDTGSLKSNKCEQLSLAETFWLSLEFSMLWFAANYFASACLEYTSVGSVTILSSTSSIWTLIFCALAGVEGFTVRKLLGVLASLAGVVLISSLDMSGASDEMRGDFPEKSRTEIAIGDAMAFFSAIVYGVYVTVMKKRAVDEDRIETFELPPNGTTWAIIWINTISSFFSDIIWAYAMLLTTPLVVTVGLSLTIPLSLIGEMIQYHQYSSWIYWVGAGIVVFSFVFVNNESHEEGNGNGECKANDKEQQTTAEVRNVVGGSSTSDAAIAV
ncbi:hypothetical protein NEUTE1DRAFT_58386 [Neurospora tetrasperma FGSC 2508]|uniref:DUF3955 domain-containing protein n=1 Tax=Neurospora tetrasperma (strain FGSC 2508 / ATCC MYA-4615 / P0657) TaxID=510951 RepID=F8MC63_NEUT8|nr:uncharacterized protein NEUTE1DRAFT_58386 [Neurospora tetrasperma FGSC 2508]EGO61218.1 hypothetical protein NEUTE1DRAFT_58386 [Neurospora tetrasperma FGSC 2508]EGZ74779.1 hypothetical protein NEUTE2DRAFT_82425 [Neurospora tetrasperma FGSC 2509]